MIMWPRFETCCCGCKLRTGVLSIGWIMIICCIAHAFNVFRLLLVFDQLEPLLKDKLPDCDQECRTQVYNYALGFMIASLVMNIFYLIIGSVTTHGVNTNKPHLLTPYLIASAVSVFLAIVMWMVALGFLVTVSLKACFTLSISVGIACALHIYLALVVKSYQIELREKYHSDTVPCIKQEFPHEDQSVSIKY